MEVEVRRVEDAGGAAAWHGDVREDALVVVDTPAVSPADEGAVRHLARRLRGLAPTEVHLVAPATVSAAAARDLVAGLRPLGPSCLTLSHVDETAHLGAVVAVAVETSLAVSYLSRGTVVGAGLEPADASAIAALVLP